MSRFPRTLHQDSRTAAEIDAIQHQFLDSTPASAQDVFINVVRALQSWLAQHRYPSLPGRLCASPSLPPGFSFFSETCKEQRPAENRTSPSGDWRSRSMCREDFPTDTQQSETSRCANSSYSTSVCSLSPRAVILWASKHWPAGQLAPQVRWFWRAIQSKAPSSAQLAISSYASRGPRSVIDVKSSTCRTFASVPRNTLYSRGLTNRARYASHIGGLRAIGAKADEYRQNFYVSYPGVLRSFERLRQTRPFFAVGLFNGQCSFGGLTRPLNKTDHSTGSARPRPGPFARA